MKKRSIDEANKLLEKAKKCITKGWNPFFTPDWDTASDAFKEAAECFERALPSYGNPDTDNIIPLYVNSLLQAAKGYEKTKTWYYAAECYHKAARKLSETISESKDSKLSQDYYMHALSGKYVPL